MSELPNYCTRQQVINQEDIEAPTETEQELLDGYITRGSRFFELKTGCRYYRVSATDEVITGAHLAWNAKQGKLLALLPNAPLVSVSKVEYRVGHPTNGWTPVNLDWVEWDSQDDRGTRTLIVWLPKPTTPGGRWLRVSYVAGWEGTADDPYHPDIQQFVIWLAGWQWRSRAAPYEKTANEQTGTVIIPSALPARLRRMIEDWKRWP